MFDAIEKMSVFIYVSVLWPKEGEEEDGHYKKKKEESRRRRRSFRWCSVTCEVVR